MRHRRIARKKVRASPCKGILLRELSIPSRMHEFRRTKECNSGQYTRISLKQVPVWLDSRQSRLEVLCRLLPELSARRQAPRPSEESPIIDACQDHCPAYIQGSGVSPPCLHLSALHCCTCSEILRLFSLSHSINLSNTHMHHHQSW